MSVPSGPITVTSRHSRCSMEICNCMIEWMTPSLFPDLLSGWWVQVVDSRQEKWGGEGKEATECHQEGYQCSFSSSYVQMGELNHKEGWAPKNWCFPIVVLEKTLESPLKSREIKPVNPKGNQSWIFTGRTGAETPILWPPDVKSWLIGKDPDAGEDWGQEEKGMTEDEMVGWYHWHDGH